MIEPLTIKGYTIEYTEEFEFNQDKFYIKELNTNNNKFFDIGWLSFDNDTVYLTNPEFEHRLREIAINIDFDLKLEWM